MRSRRMLFVRQRKNAGKIKEQVQLNCGGQCEVRLQINREVLYGSGEQEGVRFFGRDCAYCTSKS